MNDAPIGNPDRCPYCGGTCTVKLSCTGPRTSDPHENTCKEMALHRRLVSMAIDLDDRHELDR